MLRRRRSSYAFIGSVVILISITCASLSYAKGQTELQVGAQKLAENLYMVWDSGGMGNTAVLTGDDGLLLVDTKDGKSVERLLRKIAELSDRPIRFAITTHWHFDHVGGNKKIAQTGATLIAHENVRKRMGMTHDMKMLNAKVPPSPVTARPLVTFKRGLTFHMNGEDVKVFHLEPGHTDGDAVVYFQDANVIHMGDLYFEGLFPYIGIYAGGSIDGMIRVINQILPMIDEDTKVIPGHGPLSNKAGLKEYVCMLTAIRDKVSRLIQQGKTVEEVVAAQPTQQFDGKWGKGFLQPDRFARLVYMDLSPELP